MKCGLQKPNKGERGRSKLEQVLNFKGWLAANNIKQQEIADLLGISLTAANLKVNGKLDFRMPEVAMICDKYGISADIFLPKKLQSQNIEG